MYVHVWMWPAIACRPRRTRHASRERWRRGLNDISILYMSSICIGAYIYIYIYMCVYIFACGTRLRGAFSVRGTLRENRVTHLDMFLVYVCQYRYVHRRIYIYIYRYIYIYIYIYTYTYIYIYGCGTRLRGAFSVRFALREKVGHVVRVSC